MTQLIYSNVSIPVVQSSSSSYVWGNSNLTGATEVKSKTIHIQGDAKFEGNIEWQGRDMRKWFESVESRLNILHPNPELEKDWEELDRIRQQYIELERKLLEQQQVFDILKKNST